MCTSYSHVEIEKLQGGICVRDVTTGKVEPQQELLREGESVGELPEVTGKRQEWEAEPKPEGLEGHTET